MSYIYEMDVAHLRISYILPEGLHCFKVCTKLYNWKPYNRSDIELVYEVVVLDTQDAVANKFFKSFEAPSLQEATEKVRRYFIKNPYKQSPVSKSPEDGTDSVITG